MEQAEPKQYLYSNADLRKLIWPLVVEQFLAIFVGMLDTIMISGSGEAAVRALEAGADWLLCPLDYCAAFDAVVEAVGTGRLSEGRLEESLGRIRKLRDSGSSPE